MIVPVRFAIARAKRLCDNNVYERQRKANEIRNRLEQELAKAHIEAKFAWDNGATEAQMKDVLALIRQAQWRWDFGVASHGGSFHAPQEIQRILSHGLDRAMQARLAVSKVLAKNGYTGDVPMPDISTKSKKHRNTSALDMDAEKSSEKRKFLKNKPFPAWFGEKRKEKWDVWRRYKNKYKHRYICGANRGVIKKG